MTRGRIILLVLLAWALTMVMPDLRRVLQPLGSLGLYADNDGLIYDVVGPFRSREDSPAWQAGLRPGDRLDLGRMRCLPYEAQRCADALAALGGVRFLPPGRRVTFDLAATAAAPARQVVLEARQRPSDWLVRGVLLLGGLAAIAVLLAAAWLVWRRPGRMSWGFFVYAMWFNPGQVFEVYGALQAFPPLLLAQSLMAAVAQAAGYAGLLQFALRVPRDELEPRFARIERLLPWVAGVLALPLLASLGSLVGFGTETRGAHRVPGRLRRRRRGGGHSEIAPARAAADRAAAAALGDLGLPDRAAGLRDRRARAADHDFPAG